MCPPPLRRHSPNFVIITFHFLTNRYENAHTYSNSFVARTDPFLDLRGTNQHKTRRGKRFLKSRNWHNHFWLVFGPCEVVCRTENALFWGIQLSPLRAFGWSVTLGLVFKNRLRNVLGRCKLFCGVGSTCLARKRTATCNKRLSDGGERLSGGMGIYERICSGYYYEVRRMPP